MVDFWINKAPLNIKEKGLYKFYKIVSNLRLHMYFVNKSIFKPNLSFDEVFCLPFFKNQTMHWSCLFSCVFENVRNLIKLNYNAINAR